ncbi:MAG: 1,4-dihydroxy-2-naphthoate polyprenyltransferase [Egibacteraceae bacterium]
MIPAAVWVEAARPRTLPAAVAAVLVGTAAASRFSLWRFVAAMVVGVAVQVAVNYANDYFDGVRGVDTAARVGPRRAVAAGLVRPRAMRAATGVALGVAAVTGLGLAFVAGWPVLLIGLAAFAATLCYSGGPRPYASVGLGELFVFVFFGLVATAGSAYVQEERLVLSSIVAGCAMGALATALLVVNNLRDIPTDRLAGKRTLAVRLGDRRTRRLYTGLLGVLTPAAIVLTALVTGSLWPLLAFVAVPLLRRALLLVRTAVQPSELIRALEATGRLQLAVGVLLAVGLWSA